MGRRAERLSTLAVRLQSEFGVTVNTLCFDISDREATEKALESARPDIEQVQILINNAGVSLSMEPMQKARVDDWEKMIDTNVKGLLYVSRFCLPFMIGKGDGHIVNIGSVSGRWTHPLGGVYCATKFAVRALTEGMRLDLMGTGIRVTNIEPGKVKTEFSDARFGGDPEKIRSVYEGYRPLQADDIAEAVTWCLERPGHVNIQEMVIFPTDQGGVGPYTYKRK